MLRIITIAILLLVTGCTQESRPYTGSDNEGRIQIKEVKYIGGNPVFILKVDTTEYLYSSKGGIVKHR